jgi:acetoacetate decarboxylase
MKKEEVLHKAFAMPLTNPSYSYGPYRFMMREFFIITYRTDLKALKKIVPEPLHVSEPIVKYEFMRIPDAYGFGEFFESGQVIPVSFQKTKGNYVHSMYLNSEAPISGGREIWGFPKKYAEPSLKVEKETLIGTLDYGSIRIATGTMGYKFQELDPKQLISCLKKPQFLIKIIPDVDGKCKICQLVRYFYEDITLHGAWKGPSSLELHPHALAPVSDLPVLKVLSCQHFVADITLSKGEVIFDYLSSPKKRK